jgi:hypothetical protein
MMMMMGMIQFLKSGPDGVDGDVLMVSCLLFGGWAELSEECVEVLALVLKEAFLSRVVPLVDDSKRAMDDSSE